MLSRDRAVLNLMVRTGLRCIEVTRANVEDIQYKSGKRVLVIQGKGRLDKDRLVVLTDKSYGPIEEYLRTRGRVNSGEPLFTSSSNNSKGERLTTRSISKIAKDRLNEIGLTGRTFSAHGLRHTAGTNGLRAGLSLDRVAGLLGHSSTETTKMYVSYGLEEDRIKNAPEEVIDTLY
jgi:integrase/recombinase XerC/integrase/recombinase XerD